MSEFKVGDKVVNDRAKLGNVWIVAWCGDNKLRLRNHPFDHVFIAENFRHATPEEIAIGHRLD